MDKELNPELLLVTKKADQDEDPTFRRGCDPADQCGPDYDDCKPNDQVQRFDSQRLQTWHTFIHLMAYILSKDAPVPPFMTQMVAMFIPLSNKKMPITDISKAFL